MWKMLQQKIPGDFVIATGKQYSIKQFVNMTAKKLLNMTVILGQGKNEKGYDEFSTP